MFWSILNHITGHPDLHIRLTSNDYSLKIAKLFSLNFILFNHLIGLINKCVSSTQMRINFA